MRRSKRLKSTEPPVIGQMEDIFGPVKIVPPHVQVMGKMHHIPSVGPGPGERRGKRKKNWPRPEGEAPTGSYKATRDFLFPPMPGAFQPSEVRKMPLEELRDRYIKVLSATMGNHSMSLFYCSWDQEQFEDALNAKFKKRIMIAKSQLADRATFIMHQGLGLIATADGGAPPASQVTAALAKVVEKFNERGEQQEAGKGYKLVIEGLERNKTGIPPAAEAERIPQRDG